MAAELRRLLLVEDYAPYARSLARILAGEGWEVVTAATAADARAALAAEDLPVILLDLGLPDVPETDKLGFLRELLAARPERPVIVLTGDGTQDAVIGSTKSGALSYLVKGSEAELPARVKEAFVRADRRAAAAPAPAGGEPARADGVMIGRSPAMIEVFGVIGRLARSTADVLITGESGAGKELVARALHRYGPSAAGPFVTVDCASLPPSLLEAELFGYERGAFTGAVGAKPGLFEQARGGTLFLDEIGNVAPEVQVKLLGAVERKVTRRLGATAEVAWDARIVSATNADLEGMVKDGRFREDLWYRLRGGGEIRLPPLRDRREDIRDLARHFLVTAGERPGLILAEETLAILTGYDWPGNVRQLRSAIRVAAAMAASTLIGPEDLPAEVRGSAAAANSAPIFSGGREAAVTMEEMRRRYARHVLAQCAGNRSEAARLLDIDRGTLAALLKNGDAAADGG